MNKLKLLYYRFFNKKKYHNHLILKWIENAKEYYLKFEYCPGMCLALFNTIPKYFREDWNKIKSYNCEKIKHFIPEYHPEFFITKGIKCNGYEEGYWWKLNDKESRIKAFDKLIEIYKCA